MYCSNCGKEISENTRFCETCGKQVLVESVVVNQNAAKKGLKVSAKSLSAIIILIVAAITTFLIAITFLITGVAFVTNQNSLDKKLMNNTWWEEIQFFNNYSESSGCYHVTARCDRITFCPSGNVRCEEFDFGWGSYTFAHKINKENMPLYFSFPEASSDNDMLWELLDDKELLLDNTYYKWSRRKAEDTWYLKGNTLRIGYTYFTSENPGVNVDDDADRIPYWCSNCGEEGPFEEIRCPECDCKEKTKCDW